MLPRAALTCRHATCEKSGQDVSSSGKTCGLHDLQNVVHGLRGPSEKKRFSKGRPSFGAVRGGFSKPRSHGMKRLSLGCFGTYSRPTLPRPQLNQQRTGALAKLGCFLLPGFWQKVKVLTSKQNAPKKTVSCFTASGRGTAGTGAGATPSHHGSAGRMGPSQRSAASRHAVRD